MEARGPPAARSPSRRPFRRAACRAGPCPARCRRRPAAAGPSGRRRDQPKRDAAVGWTRGYAAFSTFDDAGFESSGAGAAGLAGDCATSAAPGSHVQAGVELRAAVTGNAQATMAINPGSGTAHLLTSSRSHHRRRPGRGAEAPRATYSALIIVPVSQGGASAPPRHRPTALPQPRPTRSWGSTWSSATLATLSAHFCGSRSSLPSPSLPWRSGPARRPAIFTVVDSVLLRPLPYADPERLVVALHGDAATGPVSPADYLDYRGAARSFDAVGAAQAWAATLTDGDRPERIAGLQVSTNLPSTWRQPDCRCGRSSTTKMLLAATASSCSAMRCGSGDSRRIR